MASTQNFHEFYVKEFDVDRVRFFRQNSPWTSSPILSVLVFIAVSTFIAFYMQARSLTRKMRPTASGAPPRLPATIVWGLFSLQYSQLSQYVHAQREQLPVTGLVTSCLDCNDSLVFLGLSSAGLGSNGHLPDQFGRYRSAREYQLSCGSHILSEVDELSAFQQTLASSKLKSAVKLTADELFQQAVDIKDAQDKVPSGKRLLDAESLLSLFDAKRSTKSRFIQFRIRRPNTENMAAVESFTEKDGTLRRSISMQCRLLQQLP